MKNYARGPAKNHSIVRTVVDVHGYTTLSHAVYGNRYRTDLRRSALQLVDQ